jgi:Fe-S-cluster containining protein
LLSIVSTATLEFKVIRAIFDAERMQLQEFSVFREKWYKGGLRFTCTQCGNCCTGEEGYVWVTKEEIRRIAQYLGREDDWLPKRVLRRVGFRYSLTESKRNGDCVFLKRTNGKVAGCEIYPVRPLQCRTWPFWNYNLSTTGHWAESADNCPGMNNGKRYTFERIEEIRHTKEWQPGDDIL